MLGLGNTSDTLDNLTLAVKLKSLNVAVDEYIELGKKVKDTDLDDLKAGIALAKQLQQEL